MAKYFSRFISIAFVFAIGLIDYRAWEASIENPPAAMAAMISFIFLQIPYLIIIGIICLILNYKKRKYQFVLEHLIVASVASVTLLITTFILINI